MPSDAMILYCKDDGPIVFAKEPMSHQKSKHLEQGYTRLPRVKIHRGAESRLYMGCGRPKSLCQPMIQVYLMKMGLKYMADWL